MGLAGTAVNPIGRWHRARAQDHFQPEVRFSLTFPTGRRLWRRVWDASPFKPVFPQVPQ